MGVSASRVFNEDVRRTFARLAFDGYTVKDDGMEMSSQI